jgi:hypothetical protein
MNLHKRIEHLEAQTTPDRPVGCWHWPADDLYSVNGDVFTLEEFRARYGGDPADVCATMQTIGALHWSDI